MPCFLLYRVRESGIVCGRVPRRAILAELEGVAADHGIDIVDVEVVGTVRTPTVRVRIDHAEDVSDAPITLDEVAAQSRWISEVLDRCDPFENSYRLEVSSPGLARPLRKAIDFARFAGKTVSLTTHATEGRRRFTGTLVGISDEHVISLVVDGSSVDIALCDVAHCKIKPEVTCGNVKKKQ